MPTDQDPRTTDISGIWKNQSGSELELQIDGYSLSGFYRTAVGAAKLGNNYPLVGWRDRRCLGFTVSWGPDSESLTSWSGLIERESDGILVISAMWLLVSATATKQDGDAGIVVDTKPCEAFRTQSVISRR